jgi:hypothetical protein
VIFSRRRAVKILFTALLLIAVGFVGAQPLAVVDEETFDFGQIEEGPDAVHHFKIRNEGDSTLKIINVRSS